ncbi:hypothetical protein C8Q79DRAFT_620800 [Trametes meyenii]|nr:hypothetical protein C8Q79DRAFT_620800 [Trametes meyenii]
MAQLLAPAQPGSERISQILPTVKCSNCNQPVRIADLGDHVCAPVPPVPVIPALKTPSSPRTVAALLPTRLQNLVSSTAPAQTPVRTSSPAQPPPRQKSPAPPPKSPLAGRARAPSSASTLSTLSSRSGSGSGGSRTERASSRYSQSTIRTVRRPSDGGQVPFPPGPSTPTRVPSPRIPPAPPRTPDASRTLPGTDRSPTPGRSNIAAPGTTALRPRTPSSASVRPGGGLQANSGGMRQPAQSNPAPYSTQRPDPRIGLGADPMSPTAIRQRAGTNASVRPSFEHAPEIVYSTDARARTPANDPVRMRAPSAASVRPSLDQQRPPYIGGGGGPPPARTPPPPVGTPRPEPNTQTGGEAGMAGVGRRGFAAAARAAMFTMGPAPPMPQDPNAMTPMTPGLGMDGRRANAPRFLDIASATKYATANTPPLSPGSGTASMSPHSPYSQKSPVSVGLPSPSARMSPNITPTNPAGPGIASSPTSPTSVLSLRDRVVPPLQEPPKAPLPDPPSTPRLPFFEKFKNKLPAVDTAKPPPGSADPSPLSPPSDDGSYDGLAYANSDEDDDDDAPLRASPLPLTTAPKPPGASGAASNKVRFPSMTNSESKYSASASEQDDDASSATSPTSPRTMLPQRSLSASSTSTSTSTSAFPARTLAKSTGALDRAMETLFEDSPLSPTTSVGSRPFASDGGQRESVLGGGTAKSPKLPTRSHTSPTLPSSSSSSSSRASSSAAAGGPGRGEARKTPSKRPRTRICLRCEKVIDDGRWIQVEGGNVLCDKCWKNMYLPKCRRCNKTIEKQAVSSSDGQLKGKYHKECFSCFTCEKPFPDKTFYVFDGKPFCAYHYHEENNSLCAAARCGQPIEGPCAVSHAGDRYHPEHLLCEYRGCTERLVEYYELDGRMLCERHVQKAIDDGDRDEDVFGAAGDRSTLALKRVTRFIDIAALGAGPGIR